MYCLRKLRAAIKRADRNSLGQQMREKTMSKYNGLKNVSKKEIAGGQFQSAVKRFTFSFLKKETKQTNGSIQTYTSDGLHPHPVNFHVMMNFSMN